MVCSDNNSILHHFRHITTFTVYMTDCDLNNYFIFEKMVEIVCHVRILIHV